MLKMLYNNQRKNKAIFITTLTSPLDNLKRKTKRKRGESIEKITKVSNGILRFTKADPFESSKFFYNQKQIHSRMRIFLLLLIIFLILSCDRLYYNGSIARSSIPWQLKQIDTFYARGKFRPSATWYNRYNRLNYVDNDHEFPYPYTYGTYQSISMENDLLISHIRLCVCKTLNR